MNLSQGSQDEQSIQSDDDDQRGMITLCLHFSCSSDSYPVLLESGFTRPKKWSHEDYRIN